MKKAPMENSVTKSMQMIEALQRMKKLNLLDDVIKQF